MFITCLLQKWNFAFTLTKNWPGQNRSSRTDSTGPVLPLTYEGLAGIKRLILLLYIWLDVAVKPLKYVNTLWLYGYDNPLKYGLSGIET